MTSNGLQSEGKAFAEKIFETVKRISADTVGVTRQGYSDKETEVINFLRNIGSELKLEEHVDSAGNYWLPLPGLDHNLTAYVAGSNADSVQQGVT